MSGNNIQDVRRAIVQPTYTGDQQTQFTVLAASYSQLAQEVVQVHNRLVSLQLAVAGTTSSLVVTLPSPMSGVNYSPVVILDWNAYSYLTAIAATGFTLAFSAASPGGGGTCRIALIS